MLVNKEYVESMIPRIAEKVQWWEEMIPTLKGKFDQFGRVEIAKVNCINEESVREDIIYKVRCTDVYRECFMAYMSSNDYTQIRIYNGQYESYLGNIDWLSPTDFVENSFHFMKSNGKKVTVNVSRVLAKVHELWMAKMPTYKSMLDEIKRLRKEGHTFSSSYDLRELTDDKERFERQSLSITYEKYMNANKGGQSLMLSVNPIDKLSSSGCCGDNPTKFSSCWSINMEKEFTGIVAKEYSCYSNPYGAVAIGSVINNAMIYIPNGSTLQVPNSDYQIIGYKERSHVWYDEKGLWIEKMYPTKSVSRKKEINKLLTEAGINIIDPENISDIVPFAIQDTKYLMAYKKAIRGGKPLFFDRVAIDTGDDYTLKYLPKDRMDYSYDNADEIPEVEGCCTCPDCGESFDPDEGGCITVNGNTICSSCAENYSWCEHCNSYVSSDDITYVDGDYICDSCLTSCASRCECCDNWRYNDNMNRVRDNDNCDIYVCDGCRDYRYSYCDICEEYHPSADVNCVEDTYICPHCWSDTVSTCADCDSDGLNDNMIMHKGRILCADCLEKAREEEDIAV